ncbi:MAG: sulfatase [Planctomycetes bacterium]|nr:sulfatase [Planctomycetota bacterium]
MKPLLQILTLLLLTAPISAQTSTSSSPPSQPNIVFIFSDDHAPHAIGAYGSRYAEIDPTPNIDQLASEGMLFRNSFCTNSICGPSRAVILSGKHSHKNGFMANGNRFNGDQVTFPKLLQKVGYQTAMIGKWHLHTDPQGFDYWDILPGQGDYYNPDFISAAGKRQVEGYCTDLITDMAIGWMEQQRQDGKPFLLMAQHKGPHRNWMPPLRYLNLWDDVDLPEPATLFDDYADNASPASGQEMEIDRHMNSAYDLFLDPREETMSGIATDKSGFRNLKKMTPLQLETWRAGYADKNKAFYQANPTGKDLVRWKYQRYMKNYLRTAKAVDDSVGRIVKYLEDAGLAENTIVVYASDQGFFLGDHGWYDKRWMYEESLKMPLIVRWPGEVAAGVINEQMAQNLDYAPTFLQAAGAEVPDAMQGMSLLPLLRGAAVNDGSGGAGDSWRDAIYYHYYGFPDVHKVQRHYGIRTERYKLIRYYQVGEWEMFDLKNDPDELNNLYMQPEYRDLAVKLAQQLGGLQAQYEDDSAEGEK